MAEVPSLKPLYSGKVTRKLRTAPISATQRTDFACSSRPNANNTTPNAIGVQIARLNKPILFFSLSAEPLIDHWPGHEICHEYKNTQDHGQGIVK